MKRSEAIKDIKGILDEYCDPKYLDCNNEFLAHQILYCMEEWGMKAPHEKKDPVTLRTEHYWDKE